MTPPLPPPMPLCLWLSQKGPSTDLASSNPMPGGWGRDRPPGGPRTRVAMQKSPRAQGAGKRHSVPAEIHGQTSKACGRRFGGVHRWMATACNGCMASRRGGLLGGRTLPTPACRGPFKYSAVSPCFRGIHGAKIGAPPSPPVGHLCLSERAWNGRMPSASEAASRPSAQDIRFYASFADAVERWEPENFFCKTDARARGVPIQARFFRRLARLLRASSERGRERAFFRPWSASPSQRGREKAAWRVDRPESGRTPEQDDLRRR